MSGIMPWDSIADLLKAGVERIWPNKDKQTEVLADLEKARLAGALQEMHEVYANANAQIAVNMEEARSGSAFARNWRPCFGWVGGLSFAYVYVIQPFLTWGVCVFGTVAACTAAQSMPDLSLAEMMPVVMGILGLAGARSFERIKGVIPSGR